MLLHIIPGLKKAVQPIVIVLHRRSTADTILADLLSTKTRIKVKEVEEKEPVIANHIYIAPADYHLLIEKDRSFSLDYSEKINYSRPSIDVTFKSAADVYKDALTCILLSGANNDGTEGLAYAKELGAVTIAQDPSTAITAYMPQYAISHAVVEKVMAPTQMLDFLNGLY